MAPQAPQQGGQDNSMGFFWLTIGLIILILLLWKFERGPIVSFVFAIKSAEISVISLFTQGLDATQQFIKVTNPKSVDFTQMSLVSRTVGKYLTIPFASLMLFFSFLLYKSSAKNRYRRTHSMTTLAKQERSNWPFTTPVLHLDLLHQPIDEGPWAMAQTPMGFAKKHKLLIEHREAVGTSGLQKDIRLQVTVNRAKASRVFTTQLGRAWQGADKLKPHARALFAIFAAKFKGDRADANVLLRNISNSTLGGKAPSFVGADALLKKYINDKHILKICQGHAYELTVMASMLEAARGDGVLATAEFLWLKPIDRPLWYTLNTVGRQTVPPEVGGIMAHWLAEQAIGKALILPMVDEASIALEEAVGEVIYKPDSED